MTTLAIVGGYLGAGKTTLILRAAAILRSRGKRVAVVLNDQDSGLVDTRLVEARGVPAREVAGGCFCCRFGDLIDAADQLRAWNPDVIFAEPAGSCIDLAATVLQPLKAYHGDVYRLAPLTVLVDPAREPDYLAQNQIEEADIVCSSKSDLFPLPPLTEPRPSGSGHPFVDFRVSAVTGEGIEEWLEELFSGRRVPGARLLTVDYDRYAAEEAALGWLNLHANLHLREPKCPSCVVGPLLDDLDRELPAIAHLKIFDRAASGYVKAAITAKGQDPAVEGDLLADQECDHELVVNLRAPADPAELERVVQAALRRLPGDVEIRHCKAFRPALSAPRGAAPDQHGPKVLAK
jgi:Ni2+-binding GTPase involved in maturation of urease and hydrogenase